MVIVDTSVWIAAWRTGDARLDGWMASDLILQHPFVTAELGMGSFASAASRARTIAMLDSFEQLPIAGSSKFHCFIGEHELFGSGLGFADAHLIEACRGNPRARLVTRDSRLASQARRLGVEVIE